ncbi:3-dehydroquinate dehydratase, partial [Streptococcus agalactiae]
GKLGRISRLSGDVVGSSWTFVSMDAPLAPGQVSLNDMKKVIQILDAD